MREGGREGKERMMGSMQALLAITWQRAWRALEIIVEGLAGV